MDPQAFVRLSIGSLAIRFSGGSSPLTTAIPSPACFCEIRLRGFPVQTSSVPLVSSPETAPSPNAAASSFYLEESDVKALTTPGCFYASSHACLEIVVFMGRKGTAHCGGGGAKKQQIGSFKLDVSPQWIEGGPAVLFEGWTAIGKNRQERPEKPTAELHVRAKLDPDPRYVFQFENDTKLSPQIVQLGGSVKQPIFSCKFSRERVSQVDPLSSIWSASSDASYQDVERREQRKGWKVKIHDLSGSAVAAAFITTPFVPSSGCDWVSKSNPGAWLIVRPDPCRSESWQPWGKLEVWRAKGARDSVCFRFRVFSDEHEAGGGGGVVMSEVSINAEKGGEFSIDTDRIAAAPAVPSPESSGDFAGLSPADGYGGGGGFVMRCTIQGEGKCGKPMVQLAMRHVTCVEDAAIFMALAAVVDLSIEACRPFRRRLGRGYNRNS